MPDRYDGCHTAVLGRYAIEGHVPASDVARLLRERPRASALAMPGMPTGSPGMEAAGREPYASLLIAASPWKAAMIGHGPLAVEAQAPASRRRAVLAS